jgi:hypothetical protein
MQGETAQRMDAVRCVCCGLQRHELKADVSGSSGQNCIESCGGASSAPSTLPLSLAAAQQLSPPQMLTIMEATLLKSGSPPAQPGSASTTEGAEGAGDPVSGAVMLGRLRALLGGGGQESDSFKASCAPRPRRCTDSPPPHQALATLRAKKRNIHTR